MINKYALTGMAWLLSLTATAYYVRDYVMAKQAEAQLEAVNIAVKQERIKQAEIDKIEQDQYDKLQGINNRLNADLDELRKRPPRLPIPASPDGSCRDWRELPRQIEADLNKTAADAEQCRTGLVACYQYADSLQ